MNLTRERRVVGSTSSSARNAGVRTLSISEREEKAGVVEPRTIKHFDAMSILVHSGKAREKSTSAHSLTTAPARSPRPALRALMVSLTS